MVEKGKNKVTTYISSESLLPFVAIEAEKIKFPPKPDIQTYRQTDI